MHIINTTTVRLLASTLLFSSLFPLSASAEWGVGFSMDNTQSMYKSDTKGDTEIKGEMSPDIYYKGERANLDQNSFSYSAIKKDQYIVDVLATTKRRGYESKDKKIFNGMKTREQSLDAGVRLTMNTPYAPVNLSVIGDISNTHKGQEVGFSVGGIGKGKKWNGQRSLNAAVIAGANWQSEEVVDYYYGVKTSEANANRKAYQGKAAVTPFLGFETQMQLSPHLSLQGKALYKHLPNEISDSSITKDKKQDYEVGLSLSYWF
ncbi:MAG: MipA/OmpV family protein [Thiotrichaceae bacterium]|nr:MipA/OmpV family protein [Thiotrichaceae bacterium]